MATHNEWCRANYGVLCLSCGERVDVAEAGDLVTQVVESERLKAWFLFLKNMTLSSDVSEVVEQALRGDEYR
jgi:uncharacterized protein YfaT (DUF1175 family)